MICKRACMLARHVSRHISAVRKYGKHAQRKYDKVCSEQLCLNKYGVPLAEQDLACFLAHTANIARDETIASIAHRRERELLAKSTISRILNDLPSTDEIVAHNTEMLRACTYELCICTTSGNRSELQTCVAILEWLVAERIDEITLRRNIKYRVTNTSRGEGNSGEIDIALLRTNRSDMWKIARLFEVKGSDDWTVKPRREIRDISAKVRSQVARQIAYGPSSLILAGKGSDSVRDDIQKLTDPIRVVTQTDLLDCIRDCVL